MKIIRIDASTVRGAPRSIEAVRNADVVISRDNVVLKDRDGVAGRLATEQEMARAVRA